MARYNLGMNNERRKRTRPKWRLLKGMALGAVVGLFLPFGFFGCIAGAIAGLGTALLSELLPGPPSS